MNFRLTAALFFGVVVLVAALLVTALTDEDSPTADGGLVPALASAGLKDKDVDAVELVRTQPAEEKLLFVKGPDGKWALKEPHPAKVEGYQIDRLVADLFQAKPVPDPELSTNLASHGLAPATFRATVKAGDKSATVNIGDTTRGGEKAVTYAVTSDNPEKPVAVRRSDLTGLFRDGARSEPGDAAKSAKWLADFRSRRVLGGDLRDPVADLAAAKISAGGKELALTHAPGKPWVFAAPAGYGEADTNGASVPTPDVFTGVRPLLNALTAFQVSGASDFIEKPDDLAKYGLNADNPNLVRVELISASGPPEVLFLGKPVEQDGKPVTPPKVYARTEGDPAVFTLGTDKVDALRTTVGRPDELRNKDVLAETLRDRVDAIDLTVGSQTVKLRKVAVGTGPRWVLYGGPNDPQEAKQPAVTDLLTALTRPRIAKDILTAPDDAAFAPAEQKAAVKLWTGGVPGAKAEGDKLPAEPTPTGTPVELVFGKKDADAVLLRRVADGTKTDLKVPDSLLAAAAKGRLDFAEIKLQSFQLPDATKLVLQRGSDRLEVNLTDGKWTFAEPVARKGQPADADRVSGLLTVLATLSPVKAVSEEPTPDELKRWGLDPATPRLKAAVGLKEGEIGFEFGNETEDKLYAYARQTGKPVVFTVPKVIADRLLSDDLRDRTIYRIDPDKATGLKIRGWKGPAGVQTLEFAKAGADWSAKAPAGFALDTVKLGALLAALAAPRADEYLGPGKVEYGLSVDQNPDAVELTIQFPAPTPAVTLVLGGKTPDGGRVYAASSAIPGEAVSFDPSAIRPFVKKPDSLKK